ncbi:MAG: TAXI family TRAP transporter solute-binding subunit [Burkholderiales bacterium]
MPSSRSMEFARASLALACASLMLFCLAAPSRALAAGTLTIGTAGVMGIYHPLGGAVCRMVNVTRKTHKLRCTVAPSDGSVANIKGVLDGSIDLGIAQSDMQYAAKMGEGPFAGTPQPRLRALFSLYPELFNVMAREDARIGSLADLRGKRVSLGPPGSGTKATMAQVMEAVGLATSDLASARELKFVEMAPALCENKIDAFAFVAGHPNAVFHEAADACGVRFVPVNGGPIDALVEGRPYYGKAEIPANVYRGTGAPQPTFGTRATLVASADLPDDVAYAVTKAVFDHWDDFRKLHPALFGVGKAQALEGASVPFHPGAVRYFKEAGLM